MKDSLVPINLKHPCAKPGVRHASWSHGHRNPSTSLHFPVVSNMGLKKKIKERKLVIIITFFFKTFSSQKWPRTENLALNLLYLYLYRSSSLINNIFNNPFKGLLSSPLQCTGDGHLEFWQGLGIWALSGHLDTTTVSKPSHLLYTTPHLTTPQHNTPNHTTHRNTSTPHLATVTLLHVDTDKQYILLFTAMLMINSV